MLIVGLAFLNSIPLKQLGTRQMERPPLNLQIADIDDELNDAEVSPSLDEPQQELINAESISAAFGEESRSNSSIWRKEIKIGVRLLGRVAKKHSVFGSTFELYINEPDGTELLVMRAHRKLQQTDCKYSIMGVRETDGSEVLLGKVKPNFLGTSFTVVEIDSVYNETEIAAIAYEPNLTGPKQPRKIKVAIPAFGRDGERVAMDQNVLTFLT
jgi:hypothetical protein